LFVDLSKEADNICVLIVGVELLPQEEELLEDVLLPPLEDEEEVLEVFQVFGVLLAL
jgi:hypothetical protein